jgi:hypothetical protein
MNKDLVTKIIGNEYDTHLIEKLKLVLKNNKTVFLNREWSLVGSQEFQEFEIIYKEEPLKIGFETYIGISMIGSQNMIDDITDQIKKITIDLKGKV